MKMKKHILLIENGENEVEFFTDALEESKLNYLCSRARNAEQASKMLKNIVPDIIFLDMHLPKISGTEFLKKIKSTNYLKNIPVVLYSTVSEQSKDSATKKDATQYLLLPGSVQKLASIISKVIDGLNTNVYVRL